MLILALSLCEMHSIHSTVCALSGVLWKGGLDDDDDCCDDEGVPVTVWLILHSQSAHIWQHRVGHLRPFFL